VIVAKTNRSAEGMNFLLSGKRPEQAEKKITSRRKLYIYFSSSKRSALYNAQRIVEEICDGDIQQKIEAAQRLVRYGPEAAISLFFLVTMKTVPLDARVFALSIFPLVETGFPRKIAGLLRLILLKCQDEVEIVIASIKALGALKWTGASVLLRKYLNDERKNQRAWWEDESTVELAARAALAELGSSSEINPRRRLGQSLRPLALSQKSSPRAGRAP
jgi:hypothetical protein